MKQKSKRLKQKGKTLKEIVPLNMKDINQQIYEILKLAIWLVHCDVVTDNFPIRHVHKYYSFLFFPKPSPFGTT